MKIIDTMTKNDKSGFFYLVEYKKPNGKTARRWTLAEELTDELKNVNICLCLTYIDYDFFDNWTHEKHAQTFGGAIFDSVNDFEQWKKNLNHRCEFLKLDILY